MDLHYRINRCAPGLERAGRPYVGRPPLFTDTRQPRCWTIDGAVPGARRSRLLGTDLSKPPASLVVPSPTNPARSLRAPLSVTRFEYAKEVEPTDPFPYRFTRDLLANSKHYLVRTPTVRLKLVVQDGYLTRGQLRDVATQLVDACVQLPRMLGAAATLPRELTVYIAGPDGPGTRAGFPAMSTAAFPDLYPNRGTKAVFLRDAREDRAPVYHELVHALGKDGGASESLSEGFAAYAQSERRPGHGVAFRKDGVDLRAEARTALRAYPELERAIGDACIVRFAGLREPGDGEAVRVRLRAGALGYRRAYAADARKGFYYASESFVRYLIEQRGGRERFLRVYAAGGTERAYQEVYGVSLEDLREGWREELER